MTAMAPAAPAVPAVPAALRRRAVLVHRRTELDELVDRHSTRGQAEFFLRTRGRSLAEVQRSHDQVQEVLAAVAALLPEEWARTSVERRDLPSFLFAPEDVVIVVGPDGLVANAAKYLHGQVVIGIDPRPGGGRGPLVPCDVKAGGELIGLIARGRTPAVSRRTMVRARLDDGQELTALNEIYLGHASHQSARYRLEWRDRQETQSSSGLIVSTGTGATGWVASLAHDRVGRDLPDPAARTLAWFVREAWPSPVTGASMTEGLLDEGEELGLVVSCERLVVFGDGIEDDCCEAVWGQRVRVSVAERTLALAEPLRAQGRGATGARAAGQRDEPPRA